MERNVILKDTQIEELIQFYEQKRQKILDDILALNNQVSNIDDIIKPLRDSIHDSISEKIVNETQISLYDSNDDVSAYSKKWSKSKKAEWVLSRAGELLSIRDILMTIVKMEPDIYIRNKTDERTLITQYSSTLSIKAKKNRVFYRTKNDEDVYVYGLIKNKSTP